MGSKSSKKKKGLHKKRSFFHFYRRRIIAESSYPRYSKKETNSWTKRRTKTGKKANISKNLKNLHRFSSKTKTSFKICQDYETSPHFSTKDQKGIQKGLQTATTLSQALPNPTQAD